METNKMIPIQFEHPIFCVKSLTDNLFAVGLSPTRDKGYIKIYDLTNMQTIQTIKTNSSSINCLHLLSNGNLLSGSAEGAIKEWKILE